MCNETERGNPAGISERSCEITPKLVGGYCAIAVKLFWSRLKSRSL